jgi:hypothetical protein
VSQDGFSIKKRSKSQKKSIDGTKEHRESLEKDLQNLKFKLIELEGEIKKTNETMIQKQNQLQVYKDIEKKQAENLAYVADSIWKGGQYVGKQVGYLFGMGSSEKNNTEENRRSLKKKTKKKA